MREEIIKMARKAGAERNSDFDDWSFDDIQLKRFAVFVAQHERDKVARWMIERGYATGHGDTVEDMLDELDWQVRERERQRIEDLLMEQHESAKGRHNYWQVAAEWIQVGTDEEI